MLNMKRPRRQWISAVAGDMPDDNVPTLDDYWHAAVSKIQAHLEGLPGCEPISDRVMERHRRWNYRMGWSIPVDFSDGIRRNLLVLIADDFPYVPPRIALADSPDVLTWPHLEEDGFLCILGPDAAASSEDPAAVVKYLLGEAYQLVENCISGANADDFRTEFLSYWGRSVDKSAIDYLTVLDPTGPSRYISVCHGKNKRIVGENQDCLITWLQRRGARKRKDEEYKLYDGMLVWLPKALAPKEYPNTGADVRSIVQTYSPQALPILDNLAATGKGPLEIIFGSPTPHGACFAAVSVPPPRCVIALNRKSDPLTKGFRPGRVPKALLSRRFFNAARTVTKARVERADHYWVHGRDQDTRQEDLRKAHVAVLGCGSLGGPLARLLARAGVGNLLLIDSESMDWPNVSRHELGAPSVKRSKAAELAIEIEKAFPHLGDISSKQKHVGPQDKDLLSDLASYDLVISTMGNWAAENFLNDYQSHRDGFPPILYGWTEPNAAAAHAVFIPGVAACLRCGTNNKGHPILSVTEWPNGGDILQAPACGATFTPYGPTELCWAHALLSETVVDLLTASHQTTAYHRVWIGAQRRIEAAGGTWAASWIAEMGDPGQGSMTVERPWPVSDSCPVCTRRTRVA